MQSTWLAPPHSVECSEVVLFREGGGLEKVIPDIDINESPHRGLVSRLALTCAWRQAWHCGVPPAWQVAAQRGSSISPCREEPPHASQEQLLLFQLLTPDGEGFQSDPLLSLLPLLYLWLIVSLVDCLCLSPPPCLFLCSVYFCRSLLPLSSQPSSSFPASFPRCLSASSKFNSSI